MRVAIRFLRFKVGGWQPLADALGMKAGTLVKITNARGRDVTARLAYGVARLTDTSIDDLLAGAVLPARACPHCGRPPSEGDFVHEETVVEFPTDAAGQAPSVPSSSRLGAAGAS